MNSSFRHIALCFIAVIGLLCSCDENVYIIEDGKNNGGGFTDAKTDVILSLSPITFNDKPFEEDMSLTRTLSYDFIYGNKDVSGKIIAKWDTLNSVGIFPIAPDSNSQVKHTFRSERVSDIHTSYKGQGWNLKLDNTYASYYPYQDFANTKSSKDIPMSFHDQMQVGNGNTDHLDGINNIYYATAHRPDSANTITFSYNRAAGILWVRIIAPEMDATSGTLTIASSEGKKIFTDSATVNVATGEITRIKTSDRTVLHFKNICDNDAKDRLPIHKGDTINFFLTMAPIGKTLEERLVGRLTFELRCASKTYYSNWSGAETPKANNGIWFTITPSSARRVYVDMGLPSGIQWGECNLGALLPTDHGYYFAWGETYPYNEYFWDTYLLNMNLDATFTELGISKTGSYLSKYTIADRQYYGRWYDEHHNFIGDSKTVLESEDNAAVTQLGSYTKGSWDMPTKEQFEELLENSTLTWTTDYRDSGVNGYLCTSKINGNSIFFPAAGYMGKENEKDDVSEQQTYTDKDDILIQKNARGYNSNGFYWTKSLSNHYSTDAYEFKFNTYTVTNSSDETYTATPQPNIATTKRYLGQSIRPVFHPAK